MKNNGRMAEQTLWNSRNLAGIPPVIQSLRLRDRRKKFLHNASARAVIARLLALAAAVSASETCLAVDADSAAATDYDVY